MQTVMDRQRKPPQRESARCIGCEYLRGVSFSMKKPPAIQFYPGDRLRELMPILSDSEAVGAWCKAWMYLWDAGPSPLEMVSKASGLGWDRVGFLFSEKDGLIYLPWMEEKRAEMEEFRQRQASNGKRGGRPKSLGKSKKNPGLISGKPKANPNESPRVEDRDRVEVSIYPSFNDWWNTYDKKVDRVNCEAKWKTLDQQTREAIMEHTRLYVTQGRGSDCQYRKDPIRYLRNQNWTDAELTAPRNGKGQRLSEEQLSADAFSIIAGRNFGGGQHPDPTGHPNGPEQ